MPGVLWRGTRVSLDMVEPLDELAWLSGEDIYVKPIAGYGSYADNSASADIDAGGGHVDIDLTGLTSAQKLRLERLARMVGFYADIREPRWWSDIRQKWLYGKWRSHLHMVKKDTKDASIAARAQLVNWYAGWNGLAGIKINGVMRYDKDDGPREHLHQTWTQYKTATTPTWEDKEMLSPEALEQLRTLVRDEVRAVVREKDTARFLFTGHSILKDVRDPKSTARVTPSTIMEAAVIQTRQS